MAARKNRNFIHVRVIKHLPQGLSVVLDNGERGMIRVREISWENEDAVHWKKNYPIGWDGYAFSIPAQKGEALEFSLRLTEKDPWDEFARGFDKSRVFEGVVTGAFDYGAFIEIAPGLSGLLHKSQIPDWVQASASELFWHGDKALVVIRELDYAERLIKLGMAPAGDLTGENLPVAENQPWVKFEAGNRVEKLLSVDIPRRHILVVENDASQSQVVCGWLRELGQSVDAVFSAEEGLEFLEKSQPDVALVDIGLPGMSGTDLARYVLEKYPQVQVANATDWAHANGIKDTLDELQTLGVKLLFKPLLPEDLISLLSPEQGQEVVLPQEEQKLSLSNIPKLDAKKSIHLLLGTCRKHLGVEQVFLFSLDPAQRRVGIVERSGDGFVNKGAIPQLIYSPVRDAAEDRELVTANEITGRERKRFSHLLEFSPTAVSCIGVPVPSQTSMKYALFALDRRVKSFGGEIKIYVEGMALAIGAALDQNDLRERSALMQRSALIGNATSGMMHEINNLVGPLLYGSNNLKKKLSQIERQTGKPNYTEINEEITKIQQDVRKIINTTKAFTRIAAKGRDEILRVDEIIEETQLLLQDISKGAKVSIHFSPPNELLIVRSQSVVLEQIILNVILNAIQQIAELRPAIGGWIKINMGLVKEARGEPRCRIFIEDNGPGIHTRLWEKVFDAGYTTRREGSGIGLYISRNLMQDIGGEIYISESRILSGTTFALEFPVHL
jgi:signal transduction histidine kinase/predicted RNA-binding protein with RPS1 domain/ActR/RegA family two-component response regulator